MKISTKGRYGLRALLDLAMYSSGGQVSLYSIAERQQISVNYLEQVFSLLRKAGFVKSIKGAQGGYILAGAPSEIVIGPVLRSLEGDLSVVDRDAEPEGPHDEQLLLGTIRRCVWDAIDAAVANVIDSLTLQDLIDNHQSQSGEALYYI